MDLSVSSAWRFGSSVLVNASRLHLLQTGLTGKEASGDKTSAERTEFVSPVFH